MGVGDCKPPRNSPLAARGGGGGSSRPDLGLASQSRALSPTWELPCVRDAQPLSTLTGTEAPGPVQVFLLLSQQRQTHSAAPRKKQAPGLTRDLLKQKLGLFRNLHF